MPISPRHVLRDHCVALAGVLYVVFLDHCGYGCGEIVGVRPGRGASCTSPSMPSSQKTGPPQRRHARRDFQLPGDLDILHTVAGQQHDAAALDYSHRSCPPPHQLLQLGSLFGIQINRRRHPHLDHLDSTADDRVTLYDSIYGGLH